LSFSADKEKVKKVETADTKPAGQKAPSPAVVSKTSAADDKVGLFSFPEAL